MTIKEEIIAIANQLANEGITPSVAKVKAKLSEAAPLPTIISTLKSWQHQPERTKVDKTTTKTQHPNTNDDLDKAIAKAIQPLIKEIEFLKQQLKEVNDKLDRH